MTDTEIYVPRLKEHYQAQLRQTMVDEFGYKNPMQIPCLEKIVLNMGVGEAVSDSKRIGESKRDLSALLTADGLINVPFLVLGNKIDKRSAVSEPELRKSLGLTYTSGKHVSGKSDDPRAMEIFMCSVTKQVGLRDALAWLTNTVTFASKSE